MRAALDSNVLLDIFTADAKFGQRSKEAVRESMAQGEIVACSIVWAEVSAFFSDKTSAEKSFEKLGLSYEELQQESALIAGHAWRMYRRTGGSRARVIAEFLIGAHALVHADILVTRDRGFYRKYFSALKIHDPSR